MNWNERDHPRHSRGSNEGGRFRDRGVPGFRWAQRISDEIGERRNPEGPLGPVAPIPGNYKARGTRGGTPVWPYELVADDRASQTPIDQIGRDRGDGTREATGAELAAQAVQLPGRIERRLSDGTWEPVDKVMPHLDGNGITLSRRNSGTMYLADSVVVFKEVGAITDEDRFFEMRMGIGGESEESAADVARHIDRYKGKVVVQDPNTGTWSVLEDAEEFPDVDTEDDEWSPLRFWVEGGGSFLVWHRGDPWDEEPDYGSVRIRPREGP